MLQIESDGGLAKALRRVLRRALTKVLTRARPPLLQQLPQMFHFRLLVDAIHDNQRVFADSRAQLFQQLRCGSARRQAMNDD